MAVFDSDCITLSQMNLVFNARIYYRRLTTWTRSYLLNRYYGIGTAEAQFERLYLESLDIGNMLQLIFGRRKSEEYSQLLSQYAIILNHLLDAQLSGDTEGVNDNVNRLYENVRDRALFLESINPYWDAAQYIEHFGLYIQQTLETANAIAADDTSREIELYSLLNEHTDLMGDIFAQGIYAYLTSGESCRKDCKTENNVPCITREEMDDIFTIMTLWFELVVWVRYYMLRRYTGTGSVEEAFIRLMQVPFTYIATLKKYFPDFDSNAYLSLLYTYISLIDSFITAMIANDTKELDRVTVQLYKNADERAAFLASISPLWDEDELRDTLYVNLRTTIEESNTFLSKDYDTNIDIFTRLLDQAEMASTILAKGLFMHIAENQPPQ